MADPNSPPIIESFTVVDQVSDFVTKSEGDIDLSLAGTWVGTVALQRLKNGVWQTVTSYTSNMEEAVLAGAQDVNYRFKCTAFTSGEILFQLDAG